MPPASWTGTLQGWGSLLAEKCSSVLSVQLWSSNYTFHKRSPQFLFHENWVFTLLFSCQLVPSPCRNDLSHAESRMHSEQDQQSNHCHQRLDWTWSKTNWPCSEFRAGFWTKTVALRPTLHQLLQTSFQSAVQCDMAAKSDRNGPYLKKGYQMLLQEVWVILVFF